MKGIRQQGGKMNNERLRNNEIKWGQIFHHDKKISK